MLPESLRAEVINTHLHPRPIRAAMIDFDGTLSLLREGWDQVMIPMMVAELLPLSGTKETPEQLKQLVTDWVLKLNGQPTINQMQALVDEVVIRKGSPQTAAEYKQRYLNLLMNTVEERKKRIVQEKIADRWVVPGGYQLLEGLKRRSIPMLLASGTDLAALKTEAAILQVSSHFDQGIEGPESDASTFTKAQACDLMLDRLKIPGNCLLNVGDGYVETKLTKDRGGIAIGVAYDHDHPGQYNTWRREQLYHAGADLILPDLEQSGLLLDWLFSGASA
ncbi:MAG TPA: HAD family hydrolase [Gemmatales bacterium]|nr:HAD family hydrolase [Gemmatales bacterium]